MNAMVGGVRESRLDLASQFAADHSGHGRHFETGLAKLEESDGLPDGTDEETHS